MTVPPEARLPTPRRGAAARMPFHPASSLDSHVRPKTAARPFPRRTSVSTHHARRRERQRLAAHTQAQPPWAGGQVAAGAGQPGPGRLDRLPRNPGLESLVGRCTLLGPLCWPIFPPEVMSAVSHPPDKKPPRCVAAIDVDRCTGCGACIEVCPVDCIVHLPALSLAPGMLGPCQVDQGRCIGCRLCIRLPGPKDDPYTLLVCPWQAIEMVARNKKNT